MTLTFLKERTTVVALDVGRDLQALRTVHVGRWVLDSGCETRWRSVGEYCFDGQRCRPARAMNHGLKSAVATDGQMSERQDGLVGWVGGDLGALRQMAG